MSLPPARHRRNDDPMNETTDNDADDLLHANTSSFDIQGMMSPPPAQRHMNETTDIHADESPPANTSSFDIQGMMSPPLAWRRMNDEPANETTDIDADKPPLANTSSFDIRNISFNQPEIILEE